MKFWSNVSDVLEKRRISQRTLAASVGITPGALSKYGRGTSPSIEVAARIAEALRLSLDTLVWGADVTSGREICKAPEEHHLLRELLEDFGLSELVQLARTGTQEVAWQISSLLAAEVPRALPLTKIREAVGPVTDEKFRAGLIVLRRRHLIVESQTADGSAYALVKPFAHFAAKDIGNVTLNVKRAVKILFGKVLPAIERGDGAGRLITFNVKLSRTAAEQLSSELHEWVKARLVASPTPEEGDTQVHVVFAVVVDPETD